MANYIGNLKDKDNNQLFNNEKYSTDEQKIGIWVDEKPLYRKVIVLTNTPLSKDTWNTLATIPNIKQIVSITKTIKTSSTNEIYDDYIGISSDSSDLRPLIIRYNITTGKLEVFPQHEGWTSPVFTVILEYTKTTD